MFVSRSEAQGHTFMAQELLTRSRIAGEENEILKSSLVVQAFGSQEKSEILTRPPTIQLVSQRLLLTIFVSKGWKFRTRDVSQAFVQEDADLARMVFVEAATEMDLAADHIFMVLRPLYGHQVPSSLVCHIHKSPRPVLEWPKQRWTTFFSSPVTIRSS
jgi:hypothetical protein